MSQQLGFYRNILLPRIWNRISRNSATALNYSNDASSTWVDLSPSRQPHDNPELIRSSSKTSVLGISAFYHDSAAAIIHNGQIIAAAQEERFTRTKHDRSFPTNAVKYCLNAAKQADAPPPILAVYYEDAALKTERVLKMMRQAPSVSKMAFDKFNSRISDGESGDLKDISRILGQIDPKLRETLVVCTDHHQSHAASAFYPSPFHDALIVTLDGVGEYATTRVSLGHGNQLEQRKEIRFPNSLGLFYATLTNFLGFKINSGEYKVMGLAPYGKPSMSQIILDELITPLKDGSFILNHEHFNFSGEGLFYRESFQDLLGVKRRQSDEDLTQTHMNLAASVQHALEIVILNMMQELKKEYDAKNLCLAGGVALNCVSNSRIKAAGIFENIWVQPAAGDAGGALGAAFCGDLARYSNRPHLTKNQDRDAMNGSFLGEEYSESHIASALNELDAQNVRTLSNTELVDVVSDLLMEGKIGGWFQGRAEFGPRALGHRSILAHPGYPDMQTRLNLKIKFRESFRPFAPIVLEEHANEWFELPSSSPYMLFTAKVRSEKLLDVNKISEAAPLIERLRQKRSQVSAVTHLDFSARVQTLNKEQCELTHALLQKMHQKSGIPILVNTSFNVRGEPIVQSPQDAFRCFLGTEMDFLVLGNSLIIREDQDDARYANHRVQFQPD